MRQTAASAFLAGGIVVVSAACFGGHRPPPPPRPEPDRPAAPAHKVDVTTQRGREAVLAALIATVEKEGLTADPGAAGALARLGGERQRLASLTGPTRFYDAINEILRDTGNPHLHLYRPGRDLFDTSSGKNWLVGATLRTVDGFHFVDDVWEGGPADEQGLKYGDELLALDGRAPVLDPLPDGLHDVHLWVRRSRDAAPFLLDIDAVEGDTAWYLAEATRASIRRIRRGNCTIGLIHLRTFADEDLIQELTTGAQFDHTDGLIVDLRHNRGGEVRLAGELFDLLSRQPSLWIHYHDTLYTFPPTSWNRPMVILVDENTFSSAEIFASAAQVRRLATIIGTRTTGRVQASRVFPLPDGSRLMLPISRVSLPDGTDLEGRGVIPDQTVPRPLMYADGADPPLQAALDSLDQNLACPEALPPERFPQEEIPPGSDVP